MGLRISWSSRGGLRVTERVRVGRLSAGESIPIGRNKGRRRKTRRWISFRL